MLVLKNIEVVECDENGNEILTLCKKCCNKEFALPQIMYDNVTGYYYVQGYNKECAPGQWIIDFTDNTSILVSGAVLSNNDIVYNPFKKQIKRICFSIPTCPDCWNVCKDI